MKRAMDAEKTLTVIMDLGCELVQAETEVWLVEERLGEIFDAYGFKSNDVMITADCLEVTVRTQDGSVYTQIRKVRGKVMNMDRLGMLADLSHRILKDTPEPETVEAELQEVLKKPGYPKVVSFLAAAFSAGNFTMFYNGWRQDVVLVALFAIFIMFVSDRLLKSEDNPLITNTFVAYLIEILAVAAMLLGLGRSLPSMTAGLILLLIGNLGLASGMRELLHRNVLSGLTDFMHALLGAMGIAIGISLALMTFGQNALAQMQEQEVVQNTVVQMLASIGGCVGFAVRVNCRGRVLILSVAGAALSRVAYLLTMDLTEHNYFTATLMAACFAGMFANLCGLAIGRPPTIFLTTCVLPLLPGLELYRLVYAIITNDQAGFSDNGRTLFLIIIAISLGYIIIEVIFKYGSIIFEKKREPDRISEQQPEALKSNEVK